jgi:hypothetical protein
VHRAAGVAYATIDGAPGLFFVCQRYHARLSTTACASRWRSAQRARGEAADQFARCRGCTIGAQHAGERHFARSKIYGCEVCPRCGGGARMIAGRLCISCYNRELEFRRGRNGKGTKPTIFLPERRVGVLLDFDDPGERRRFDVIAEFAFDAVEVATQILRVAVGKVAFTAPSYGGEMTMEEFTRFMASRLPVKPRPKRRLLGAARGRRPHGR